MRRKPEHRSDFPVSNSDDRDTKPDRLYRETESRLLRGSLALLDLSGVSRGGKAVVAVDAVQFDLPLRSRMAERSRDTRISARMRINFPSRVAERHSNSIARSV